MEAAASWLNIIIGSGGAIIIGALINAIMSRRKLGAEATKLITDAAAGVVEQYKTDNARLRIEVADQRAEIERLQARFDAQAAEIAAHLAWDDEVLAKIMAVLPPIEIRKAPPLRIYR